MAAIGSIKMSRFAIFFTPLWKFDLAIVKMKAIIISVLVSLAVAEVFGASLYGEREEAQQEVDSKFKEVQDFLANVKKHVDSEKSKNDDNAKNDAIAEGQKRKQITQEELKNATVAYTRTAIAKGKPLAAIECIAKTSTEGNEIIYNTEVNHKKAVEQVLPNRQKRINLFERELELIKLGLEGLKKEFDEKLKAAKGGFKELKNDGLRKANTARKQLEDLEINVSKPTPTEEYRIEKRKMEAKFKEIKQNLIKRLQQCVA